MEGTAFVRVYVDLSPDVNAILTAHAKEAGMSKKAYLAQLIKTNAVQATANTGKAHAKSKEKRAR